MCVVWCVCGVGCVCMCYSQVIMHVMTIINANHVVAAQNFSSCIVHGNMANATATILGCNYMVCIDDDHYMHDCFGMLDCVSL